MDGCAFCNADGDFLIVPQQGSKFPQLISSLQSMKTHAHCVVLLSSPGLFITTECGKMLVSPGEIVVIPQGFRFAVDLPDGPSRGYVSEIFGAHFQLPDLGPIGNSTLLFPILSHSESKESNCVCRCQWFGFTKGFPFPHGMV